MAETIKRTPEEIAEILKDYKSPVQLAEERAKIERPLQDVINERMTANLTRHIEIHTELHHDVELRMDAAMVEKENLLAVKSMLEKKDIPDAEEISDNKRAISQNEWRQNMLDVQLKSRKKVLDSFNLQLANVAAPEAGKVVEDK